MINVEHISKIFWVKPEPLILFDRLSFQVGKGEILTILGPNGCGKSTLLNMLSGVEPVGEGRILLNESKSVSHELVAYMLQKDLLLPWLSVIDNIRLGVKIKGSWSAATEVKIDRYLKILGIVHLRESYPGHLSGGERQKIALVRTLVLETPILLLDEPFSAIDYNSRLELQRTIFNYAKENQITVVLISHDIDEAISMSDRIIMMDFRPNGIKMDLLINLNISDRNPVTARFDPQYAAYYQTIWKNYPR